ncbi:MAG: iron-sulfur cluster assembly protein [candidate division WOR-3 bacterium]
MDRKMIVEKMREVIDPEIGMDIVTLGLIYGFKIENDKVFIDMTLTFPGCPLASMMISELKQKIEEIAGEGNVNINLVFEPKWNQTMISDENHLSLIEDEK